MLVVDRTLLLALAIYFYGKHQARLRRRSAIDTFTREEIDSAFVEDEQLRTELSNLNQILRDNELEENLDDIQINPVLEVADDSVCACPTRKSMCIARSVSVMPNA